MSNLQQDCQEFYGVLRAVHAGVFTSPSRKAEELTQTRYTHASHPTVRNLGSFIDILHRLLGDGPRVRGVDFGCGSHWFVDHVRAEFGWDAVGYDADPTAIQLAHQPFPASASFYRHCDLLQGGLPEPDHSVDFVFCNAVIQHFDDAETELAMAEMARVLRPSGILLLIFKCWAPELADGQSGDAFRVLDARTGTILFRDPSMKKAIDRLVPAQREQLSPDRREGWRLLHFFAIEQLVGMATRHGLSVADEVPLEDGSHGCGTLTYHSGKGVPNAAIVYSLSEGIA